MARYNECLWEEHGPREVSGPVRNNVGRYSCHVTK